MTQQYTPVTWQDETTSQQGTLINAERLNQMQTAHHYADGLEEVDAIPTADPGVSYHKIVYCTADSTIYRWDGTEWTADIDDETKALLQQEIARATAAEGGLAQSIEDEATARETADSAMQEDISDLGDAIEAEETARGQADTALGTRITNETSARETADTGLGNRITAEATARADADTALGGRIDTEQARAEAAEQANAQAIANTYTKAEIDTALGGKADQATTYSKTETDTLLAGKADQATTYTKSEVQTYVSNALDSYLPMVRTSGNQAISGVKDFTAQLLVTGVWDNKVSQNVENGSTWRRIYYTTTANLSNQVLTLLVSPQKGNNDEAGIIVFYATTSGVLARWLIKGRGAVNDNYCIVQTSGGLFEIWAKNYDGNRGLSFMRLNETNWGSLTNNWTRDLTTKDANFDPTTYARYAYPTDDGLAHTYGDETIQGVKTFYSTAFTHLDIQSSRASGNLGGIYYKNGSGVVKEQINGTAEGNLNLYPDSTQGGAVKVIGQRAYNSANTDDVATIGTLDAYSPMVRTSGSQTIAGEKTLTSRLFLTNALNYKPVLCLSRPDATKPWRKIYTAQGGSMSSFTLLLQERITTGILTVRGYGASNQAAVWNLAPNGITKANYLVTVKSDGVIEVWHKQADAYDTLVGMVLMEWNSGYNGGLTSYVNKADYTTEYTEPQAADYTQYITPS